MVVSTVADGLVADMDTDMDSAFHSMLQVGVSWNTVLGSSLLAAAHTDKPGEKLEKRKIKNKTQIILWGNVWSV